MNTKACSLILCINSFSGGILVPCLTLFFINKGLTLSEVSIILGIYALSIIVMEVPSGIAADLLGRKKIFCISLLTLMAFLIIMLYFNNFIVLSLGIIFYGISKAFSSGSLDALYIDWYNDIYGKEKLSKAMTNLLVLETIGLALGSVIGGILPSICQKFFSYMNTYDLNIILKIILTCITAILTSLFIKEFKMSHTNEDISLNTHLKHNILLIKNNRTLLLMFISLFSTGFFLLLLETYWQPQLLALLPNENMLWILGVISFLYFISNMVGSLAADKISHIFNGSSQKIYILSRVLLSVVIIMMSFQKNYILFIIFYSLTYFIFGIANVPEGVIINSMIPNENRASILSFSSLVSEIGCLASSFIGSILINYISISQIWIIGSICIFISILLFKINVPVSVRTGSDL